MIITKFPTQKKIPGYPPCYSTGEFSSWPSQEKAFFLEECFPLHGWLSALHTRKAYAQLSFFSLHTEPTQQPFLVYKEICNLFITGNNATTPSLNHPYTMSEEEYAEYLELIEFGIHPQED